MTRQIENTVIWHNPVLVLFFVLAAGTALGKLKIRGIALGSAGVLFTALAVSAFDAKMAVPEVIGSLGLAMFAYCVGVTSGPAFFSSLSSIVDRIGLVLLALGAAATTAVGLGTLAGLKRDVSLGIFAGATTNTPALAAVTARSGEAGAAVGYSIAYPGAVIIMMVTAALAMRRATTGMSATKLLTQTIEVKRKDLPELRDTGSVFDKVVFSRYSRHAKMGVVTGSTRFCEGDLVVAVGDADAIKQAVAELGELTTLRLNLENTVIDTRRITVSSPNVIGKRIGDLDLVEKFGGRITRVRRMDLDMLADDDLILVAGDRVRVAAPREVFGDLRNFFGHSEHASNDFNPLGLGIGITLAVVIGMIKIPIGSGHISLGAPAAAVILGMVAGVLRRSGPVTWTIPPRPCNVLTELGLVLFLAMAGGKAGGLFVSAIRSPLGIKALLIGLATTTVLSMVLLFGVRLLRGRPSPVYIAGMTAGADTQPAVMGLINTRSSFHPDGTIGYVATYPAAMLTKILIAQLLPL